MNHHHILSRQCVIQACALSVQSLRSWSVQCGPSVHSERMWSTVCFGFPHGHSLLGLNFHLCRVLAVLPTLALALLSDTQCFLGRFVPVGRCSLGRCTASLGVLSQFSQISTRQLAEWSGWMLLTVRKLFLYFSLLSGHMWPNRGCLLSVSRLSFCMIA